MTTQSQYNKVTDEVIALLINIVGEKNVLTEDDEVKDYSRDEMVGMELFLPEVVVKPGSSGEVSKILEMANRRIIPVTPRGRGTGLSGGAVPVHGGIVLSLERMDKIIEIDTGNFTADVEAGVMLSDLYQAVAEQGLYYPLYPGEPSAAIGGNVATNAGGTRAVKYGVTRHYVLGLEAVLPSGEIVKTGGKFVKSSTGYDLTQLITGSEGTLAVITRVLLKLVPPPGKMEILFVPFNNLHDAIHSVPDILKRGILPVGIEFMQQDIIKMTEEFMGKEIPMNNYEAYLMIIVEGDDEDEIQRWAEEIGGICLDGGAIDVFLAGSEKVRSELLDFRGKFYYALQHFGMIDHSDVTVPRSKIAELVETVKKIGDEYGIKVMAMGHAGDGNVHLAIMGKGEEWIEEKVEELMKRMFETGVSLGGTISGEHGLGYAKKEYLGMVASPGKVELMKRIKQAFDPNGIMNPGKVF
ncbi:FAD-binding oxidoreductase [Chloroflexota bacterium]